MIYTFGLKRGTFCSILYHFAEHTFVLSFIHLGVKILHHDFLLVNLRKHLHNLLPPKHRHRSVAKRGRGRHGFTEVVKMVRFLFCQINLFDVCSHGRGDF